LPGSRPGGASTARALDPNKNLTQYVHRNVANPGGSVANFRLLRHANSRRIPLDRHAERRFALRWNGVHSDPRAAIQFSGDVWARSMMEDGGGRLWISPNDFQLIRIIAASKSVLRRRRLPTQYFSCLVRGSGDDIWACTPTGLFASRETKFEVHESPAQIGRRPDTGCRATDGKIWMAGGDLFDHLGRLAIFAGCAQIHGRQPGIAGIAVHQRRSVDRNREGPSALYRWRRETYTSKDGLADDPILCLSSGRDGTVWVGTRSGFSRVRKGSIETYSYRERSLAKYGVLAL